MGKLSATGQDLSEYDYVSVGKWGFVPVNVKPRKT
jgi:hypothetical protein